MDITIGTIVVLDAKLSLRPFRGGRTYGVLRGKAIANHRDIFRLADEHTAFEIEHGHLRLRGHCGAVLITRQSVEIELGVDSAEIVGFER